MNDQRKETIIGIGEAAGCALEFTLVHMAITTFPPMIFIPIAVFWIQAFAPLFAMLWARMRYSASTPDSESEAAPSQPRQQKPLVLRVLAMLVLPLLAYTASLAFAIWEESTVKVGVFSVPQDLFSSPDTVKQLFAKAFVCGKPCVVNLLFMSPVCEEIVFRRIIPQIIASHQGESASRSSGLRTRALWSALFFGAYHIVQLLYSSGENPLLTLFQIADAAVIGWYFFWVDYDVFSGSILPSIVLHMLNNVFSAFVTPNYEKIKTVYGLLFFCASLAIEIMGYVVFVALFARNKGENGQKKKAHKKKN